jgi:hypothetical protein
MTSHDVKVVDLIRYHFAYGLDKEANYEVTVEDKLKHRNLGPFHLGKITKCVTLMFDYFFSVEKFVD